MTGSATIAAAAAAAAAIVGEEGGGMGEGGSGGTGEEPALASQPELEVAASEGYFDLNVLKGVVSTNTKPFKHRMLVWIGFWKVILFPFNQHWWLERISGSRFAVGFVLYFLHNACAFLYTLGCLPRCTSSPPSRVAANGAASVTQTEILLPYVIGTLFAVGYGSVVAARSGGTTPPGKQTSREDMHMRMQEDEDGHMNMDDDDDDELEEDEYLTFSGSGSDSGGNRSTCSGRFSNGRCGRGVGSGSDGDDRAAHTRPPPSPSPETVGKRLRAPLPTRSTSGPARVTFERGEGGPSDLGASFRREAEGGQRRPSRSPTRLGTLQAGGGVVCCSVSTGGSSPKVYMGSLSSYDLAAASDAEDEEEEDDGGWGQVVVKPVKVAQYDVKRRSWSKTMLPLPELRRMILARAENTPQKVTYQHAATMGLYIIIFLPAMFALCTMVAAAWANTDDDGDAIADISVTDSHVQRKAPLRSTADVKNCDVVSPHGEGAFEIERWASQVLERALRAAGALIMRALQPAAGDGAASVVAVISACSVAFLAAPTFRALADAERTYQRRYMYSKYFCALTSSQRARKHGLPYFSLKNVTNIRVWLALRAGKTWLRRHRRERSADAVVSMSFFLSLVVMAAILSEVVSRESRFLSGLVHWELLVWCYFISFFLLRYLTLGSNTNNRYRDTSVLLTEQINVQLRILQNSTRDGDSKETKQNKRERLVVSSNVLKLATKLLKELDGPNKLSGLSMNPVLYNVTRVVLVSALSGVMSDTLGFNIKLWKVISFK